MDGPFDWETIHAIMGDDFIVHRRFGVDQEDKIRSVDDATESGLNAIIRLGERLTLIKPDWPVSRPRSWNDCLSPKSACCSHQPTTSPKPIGASSRATHATR
jgi:hypothetical protein